MDMVPAGPLETDPIDYYRGRDLAELATLIDAALTGIELGAYDRRIVEWLKGWDSPTIVAIASLIQRARAAGPADRDRPNA